MTTRQSVPLWEVQMAVQSALLKVEETAHRKVASMADLLVLLMAVLWVHQKVDKMVDSTVLPSVGQKVLQKVLPTVDQMDRSSVVPLATQRAGQMAGLKVEQMAAWWAGC